MNSRKSNLSARNSSKSKTNNSQNQIGVQGTALGQQGGKLKQPITKIEDKSKNVSNPVSVGSKGPISQKEATNQQKYAVSLNQQNKVSDFNNGQQSKPTKNPTAPKSNSSLHSNQVINPKQQTNSSNLGKNAVSNIQNEQSQMITKQDNSDQQEEQKEFHQNFYKQTDEENCQLDSYSLQREDSQVVIQQIKQDNLNQDFKIRIDGNNSFEASIADLLRQDIKEFKINLKKIIYKRYIDSLTEEEKKMTMKYVRVIDEVPFPKIISPLLAIRDQGDTKVFMKQGIYLYEKPKNNERQWYVNFADYDLFGFYESSLFAQDEIQVSEHPLLPHVLERVNVLKKQIPELAGKTCIGKTPTPILITNCFRLGTVDIQGGKFYGNNFQKMTTNELDKNMKVFGEDKTISNLICMVALSHQRGMYTQEQIKFTLVTAYKAFYASRYITEQYNQLDTCVVNTGNWGCGAFGNNLVLIALVQLFASQLAKIKVLVYYTFDDKGTRGFLQASQYFNEYKRQVQNTNPSIDQIVEFIYKLKLKWGVSDGN